LKMEWMKADEKQYVNEILDELKRYRVSSKNRKKVKQQMIEHIQESRVHGHDSLEELGDVDTFVKDYIEINEIDVHSQIKKIQTSKNESRWTIVIAFLTSMAAYLISQLIFSLFLTESFTPLKSASFEYNILYRISEHSWWNVLLVFMSMTISLFAGLLILFINKRKFR
jgi:hypothetical protein